MLWIANFLYLITLLPHYAYHRLCTGKYGDDAPEKLGVVPTRATAEDDSGRPCLWVHAVSVGETLGAVAIIDAFRAAYPDWDIRVSTTTATGRAVATRKFGAEQVIYFPLDCSWMVRRTFCRIRPSLVVLMELEVWPNFLLIAGRENVPVVVANVRITKRSARRFSRWQFLAKRFLPLVRRWLCQDEEYAKRLNEIGVPDDTIEVVDSIKFDQVPAVIDPSRRETMRQALSASTDTPIWVAGSTHPGEDEIILAAFRKLRAEEFPQLKLLLVPRHPERVDQVEILARTTGCQVARLSDVLAGENTNAAIIMGDTVGDLNTLYHAAEVVFMGGSLIAHGGQNMIESGGLGIPTVIGPSVYNFAAAMAVLRGSEGIIEIASGDDLTAAIADLLRNEHGTAQAMGQRARAALLTRHGATKRTIAALSKVIERTKN